MNYPKIVEYLVGFARDHLLILKWLSLGSFVTFCATPLLIMLIVLNLPADYFAYSVKHRPKVFTNHSLVYLMFNVAKNILGFIFLLTGLVLLFLPGQGVLTILIGVMLMDFPGKFRLERRLIAKPGVRETIDRLRRRFNKPPLVL